MAANTTSSNTIKIKFSFEGDVYANGSFVNDQFIFSNNPTVTNANYTVYAVSLEDAITTIHGMIANKLKILQNRYIGLVGLMTAYYVNCQEVYEIDHIQSYIVLRSVEVGSNWDVYKRNTKNQIKYHGTWVYLEQAKYLYSLELEENAIWIIVYEDGTSERIQQELLLQIENNRAYLEYNEDIFWYNDADRCYYKDDNIKSDKIYRYS